MSYSDCQPYVESYSDMVFVSPGREGGWRTRPGSVSRKRRFSERKRIDEPCGFGFSHVQGMPLSVKEDERFDPLHAGFLRAGAVLPRGQGLTQPFQEPRFRNVLCVRMPTAADPFMPSSARRSCLPSVPLPLYTPLSFGAVNVFHETVI